MKNYANVFLLLIIYIEFLSYIQIINSSELDEVGKHIVMNFRKEIPNKDNNLSPDKYMEEIMYIHCFSKYSIGAPTQKIKFYYEINSYESIISEDYYLKIRSSSYECLDKKKCPKKTSDLNDYNLTDKDGYLSKEIFELNPTNKIENFIFILKPKGKTDSSTIEIPNIIGLGLNPNINNKKNKNEESLSFMEQLKRKNYIAKKIFTPLTGDDSIDEGRFYDGHILIGVLLHEVNPFYEEKDLKWISMKDNTKTPNRNWHINFDTVKYNNEIIKDSIAILDLSLNAIIAPESFRQKLIKGFFKKHLDNKKCEENLFFNLKDEEHYIYYSCSNEAEFIEIPKLSFYSKALNETFELTFDTLFTKYKTKFFFNVIFRKRAQDNWVLGQLFLNNYKFVFDTEEERIGYYKIKIQENHPYIAILSIVIAFVIFFIIYLNRNIFNIGGENIFYNQQLQKNLHPQERKEYINDVNDDNKKEKNKKIKSNKKEKSD